MPNLNLYSHFPSLFFKERGCPEDRGELADGNFPRNSIKEYIATKTLGHKALIIKVYFLVFLVP